MSLIAQDGYVILGRQVAKGTPQTTLGAYGLRVTSDSVGGMAERLDDDPEIGGGRDYDTSMALMGGFRIGGTLEGLFRPKVFGLLLLAAGFTTSGAPVQDGATGAYTQTFIPGAFTYLTIEGRWGQSPAITRASDCLVNELKWSLDANGKVTWSAEIIGRTESYQGSPSVPVFETDPVASYDGSAVTFDGLGTYRWESLEVTIANGLSDDEWVIGSRLLEDVTPGSREVTIGGRIKVGDNSPAVTDLYRASVYGSKTATAPGGSDPYHTSAAATLGSTRKVLTSNTVYYGATVTIPDAVMTGVPLEASGNDRLTVDIEAKAYKGAGNVCSIDLRNAFSTNYTAA